MYGAIVNVNKHMWQCSRDGLTEPAGLSAVSQGDFGRAGSGTTRYQNATTRSVTGTGDSCWEGARTGEAAGRSGEKA